MDNGTHSARQTRKTILNYKYDIATKRFMQIVCMGVDIQIKTQVIMSYGIFYAYLIIR